jgi:hypothetical protein
MGKSNSIGNPEMKQIYYNLYPFWSSQTIIWIGNIFRKRDIVLHIPSNLAFLGNGKNCCHVSKRDIKDKIKFTLF